MTLSESTIDRYRLSVGYVNGAGIAFFALAAGSAMALGLLIIEQPFWQCLLMASSPAVFFALAVGADRAGRLSAGHLQFGILWGLLVVSTFVWRGRTTQELNANPLDAAGMVRAGLVAIAGVIAFASLTRSTMRSSRAALHGGVAFLALYAVVGVVSAVGSPLPLQAFYRIAELTVGLLVILLARILFRERAGEILVRFAVATVGLIVALVWLEAIAMPSRAWQQPYFYSISPYVLTGPVPSFASNTIGLFGAVLAIWGLAHARLPGHRLAWFSLAVGLATLAATQYRTGVAAFLIAGAVVMYLRRRFLVVISILATVGVVVVLLGSGKSLSHSAEAAFTRGQPAEQIRSLNGRVSYWTEAWSLTEQRPVFGWGLTVGGRLATTAAGDESSSTVHGTWVEVLVGTGFIGLLTLALAPLIVLVQALRNRANPLAIPVIGLLIVLLVRSSTGTTFELFSILYLFFAALAVAASDMTNPVRSMRSQRNA